MRRRRKGLSETTARGSAVRAVLVYQAWKAMLERRHDLRHQQGSKSNWITGKSGWQRKGPAMKTFDRRLRKLEDRLGITDAKPRILYIVSRIVQRIGLDRETCIQILDEGGF